MKITVDAPIGADPDTVWTLYTAPEHITQWNFASDDWECPSAENDLRVGGRFSSRMAAKDGSRAFDFGGVYTSVDPPRSLSYALDDGREVAVDFAPQADGVHATVTFEAENEFPHEMQRDGWQAILNNFKQYAEQQTDA